MPIKTLAAVLAAALLGAGLLASPASRAEYPEQPIRVIVPYGAGGSTDVVVRTIINAVNDQGTLGQPVAVLNITGGGGPSGFFRVRDAEPDGYEILATHLGLLVSAAVGTTPFGAEAFEPVAQTGSTRFVSTVHADSPYQSFDDLVAAAKERPGEIPEANSIGGAIHMASLALAQGAGYELRVVQVGGGADRLTSILGGITEHTLFTVAEYKNFEAAGLRALAFLGPERHPDLPDIASTGELDLGEGISVDTWWFAPKDTPADVVARFADALSAAMADPELQETLRAQGVDPNFLAGEDLVARMEGINAQVGAAAPSLRGE